MTARSTLVATLLVGACGDPAARVTLVPVHGLAECGKPTTRAAITLTAYAGSQEEHRAVPLDDRIDLSDLPVDTVQIGVEVVAGGVVVAAGKTAPLDFANLPDGAAIPIFMGTADGFCPTTNPMIYARQRAQLVPAGDGALVIDGDGGAHAEYYDRAKATFEEVAVPAAFADGLAGAVLTPLPDGKVAMSGAVRGLLAVFDPDTRTFGAALALSQLRAFHGAVALDATHVIVSGGCAGLCPATPLRSTIVYDLDGNPQGGPNLPMDALSEGGQLLDTGGDYVLAGGFGALEAYRFALGDAEAEKLAGTAGQPALLDGGAVLTAFAADGDTTPAQASKLIAPGGGVVALRDGPALAGARMIALEDGSVLVVGGALEIARYVPTRDGWEVHPPRVDGPASTTLPVLTAPALARLSDGSVLVIGGDAAPSQTAWIYRPSLIGPASGLVIAAPLDPAAPGVLTVPDPATLVRDLATWQLVAPDPDPALAARALVGGPRMQRGLLQATVTVTGGLALIAQQVTPGRALAAVLVPGEQARLVQLADGKLLCTGELVQLPPGGVTVTLAVAEGVSVQLDGNGVLACDHEATDVGQWGLAAFGAGSRVTVTAVTLSR